MPEVAVVFVILGLTFAAFVSGRWRLDVIALLSLLALLLTGILSPAQALAGFSDPLVVMIASLFVVSGALLHTGVAERAGRWLARVAGQNETRLIVMVMLFTGLLSGLMSTTGTVAVMLPVVLSLCWKARISPSKVLLPMVFAASLGAMLTLVATPPNIVVSEHLQAQGMDGFGFFAYTPIGLAMLAVGIVFMATVGRRWLVGRAPDSPGNVEERPSLAELTTGYGVPAQLFRLTVPGGSPLVGASLRSLAWPERHQVMVLTVESPAEPQRFRVPWRGGEAARVRPPSADTVLGAGDRLLLRGEAGAAQELATTNGAELSQVSIDSNGLFPDDLGLVEVLLTPGSRLLDASLKELRFRDRYGAQVIGVRRRGMVITEGLPELRLRFGDTLLVQGGRRATERLKQQRQDLVVLAEPADTAAQERAARKAPVALAILAAMLAAMTFGWLPLVVAALAAALAMVLSGCLRMDQVYDALQPESLVLIAAILPLATALDQTGGIDLVVGGLLGAVGEAGPLVVLLVLFLLTAAVTQVISNTTTAVLLAPIAFQLATSLEVSPYPLLMTVALGASCAFISPVSSPVNTLVLRPGQYRFADFAKVGVPMLGLVLLISLVLVPRLFPF